MLFRLGLLLCTILCWLQGQLLAENWDAAFLQKATCGDPPRWMIEQISKDLEPFAKTGISQEQLDTLISTAPNVLFRLEILNNEIIVRHKPGINSYAVKSITEALKKLAKIISLPNIDIVFCLLDSALYHEPLKRCRGPILSFSKRLCDPHLIATPDAEALNGYSHVGHPCFLTQVIEGNKSRPWRKKISKAFWRGATTGYIDAQAEYMKASTLDKFPRIQLCKLSVERPDIINAKFNWVGNVDLEAYLKIYQRGYVQMPSLTSIKSHLRYKYQILVDGYTCSFSRAYWQLFSNSLILKNDSPDFQWYYGDLKPYVHYVPVAHDFSNLVEKIAWAQLHEREVLQIIANANEFAETHLHNEDIFLYFYLLLVEYAKLQVF